MYSFYYKLFFGKSKGVFVNSKQDYRAWAKGIRRQLNLLQIGDLIYKKIIELPEYKKAVNIAAFNPYKTEPNISPLFKDIGKKWYFPTVVDEETMVFDERRDEFDLIIVPALIVDKKGYRLGYGKGYYDRFLTKLNEDCIKIVPVPDELVVECLPHDEFDIPVDMAVTQSKILCY